MTDITEDGGPHRFELFHTDEEGATRLNIYRMESFADAEPGDLAQEIWDTAESDADTRGIGMHQRYSIVLFRNEDDREHEAQCAFNMRGSSRALDNFSGADSEKATAKGFQAQQMRHTEILMKQLLEQSEATSGRLMRENEKLRQRVEFLENKFGSMLEMQQDLMDRSHQRKLEEAKQDAAARRHEELMAAALSMSKLLAAKYMGGAGGIVKNLPASAARDGAIGNLLGNLDHEEMNRVINSLRPENQAVLLQLYNSYREDYEKQEQQKPEILRSNGSAASTKD